MVVINHAYVSCIVNAISTCWPTQTPVTLQSVYEDARNTSVCPGRQCTKALRSLQHQFVLQHQVHSSSPQKFTVTVEVHSDSRSSWSRDDLNMSPLWCLSKKTQRKFILQWRNDREVSTLWCRYNRRPRILRTKIQVIDCQRPWNGLALCDARTKQDRWQRTFSRTSRRQSCLSACDVRGKKYDAYWQWAAACVQTMRSFVPAKRENRRKEKIMYLLMHPFAVTVFFDENVCPFIL